MPADELPAHSRVAILDSADAGDDWAPTVSLARERVTALQTRSANYSINKATPDCSSITGYTVTYDGGFHTASGNCTGVGGASDVLTTLDKSGTRHKDAGTYNGDAWTFTDTSGNYNNANGTVNDKINQAGGNVTRLTVMGGFLQVASNVVRIVARRAGPADS